MVLIASDRGCGAEGGGYVYAFDQQSGKLRWKFKASGPSTSFVEIDGAIVFGTREDEWLSVDLDTGKMNWKFGDTAPDPQCEVPRAPVTDGEKVYFAAHNGAIYALEPKQGRMVWRHKPAAEITTSLAMYKDVLYYGTANHHFIGLDIANGKMLSDLELPAAAAGRTAWAKRGDSEIDYLFAVEREEKIHRGMLLGLTDEFESIEWSAKSDREWTSEQPHVWKRWVIAGNCQGDIVAYGTSDGQPQWRDHVKGCIRSFGHDATTLYVGVQEGTMYAYRPPQ
jgi:outer membrane protein assembly factor BamB